MNKDILKIKNKIIKTLKLYDIKRAAVFGSVARGEAKKNSDIDILIEFKNNDKTLFDLVGLKMDLEKMLKKRVDVLTYNSLHPLLRDAILEEQKAIL